MRSHFGTAMRSCFGTAFFMGRPHLAELVLSPQCVPAGAPASKRWGCLVRGVPTRQGAQFKKTWATLPFVWSKRHPSQLQSSGCSAREAPAASPKKDMLHSLMHT